MKRILSCGVPAAILLALMLFSCDSLPDIENITITFDCNGGSEVELITASFGTFIIKPNDPVLENYAFDGWFKDPELLQPWDFDNDQVTSSITLYAKWLKSSFKITFHPNGGSGSMQPQTFTVGTGGMLNVNDNNIQRGGFHFISWNTAADRSGNEHTQGSFVDFDDDVTLYAQWYIDYSVGAMGPSGGYVFYKKTLPIFVYPEWMYMEAAPVEYERTGLSWGNYFVSSTYPNVTSSSIGTGLENTQLIINVITDGTAAHYCDDLAVLSVRGWFLPSEGELRAMLRELHCKTTYGAVGGFTEGGRYLSSTENWVTFPVFYYDTNARAVIFNKDNCNPNTTTVSKSDTTLIIRPARRF